MRLVGTVAIVLVFLTKPAICKELRYVLDPGYGDTQCGYNYESKRREIITTYNLPKDINWGFGVTKNEWGDEEERFCYLKYGATAYIYRPFHFILLPDKPVEILRLR